MPSKIIKKINMCDTCCRGYDKPNRFGLCLCWCSKCYNLSSDCRYSCKFYTTESIKTTLKE